MMPHFASDGLGSLLRFQDRYTRNQKPSLVICVLVSMGEEFRKSGAVVQVNHALAVDGMTRR